MRTNYEWTRDTYLFEQAGTTISPKSYTPASDAYLAVVGAEMSLAAPYVGRLWLSPSYISVRNGWALGGGGGTEVMHAQNGLGIATNYLAWTNTPSSSTGSGSMLNFGFLYENTLSSLLGEAPGSRKHDVRLNVFGLLADASLDLPSGTKITQNQIRQFKLGADVTVQAANWLALMVRGDEVNYDLDHPAYIYSVFTARLSVLAHILAEDSIYFQYSRYIYGDLMTLAGQWPWGTPLVAGSDVLQRGAYAGKVPDENVVKLQATVAF